MQPYLLISSTTHKHTPHQFISLTPQIIGTTQNTTSALEIYSLIIYQLRKNNNIL